jgi:hypothetical protein
MCICVATVAGASGAAAPEDARKPVRLPAIHEQPPSWAQGGTADDRQRRQRSRTAYRSLGRHRALALARDTFSDVVSGPVYDGLDMRAGEKLVRYTSDRSALIEYPDGVRGVAQSGLPLVVDGADGREPVDLAVEDDGSGPLEPESPLVETEIGAVASEGFSFPDTGISVRPVGAAAADATVQSGKVFYSETDTDTDELVLPSPSGVETFDILRSVDSPEERAYDLSLPQGAKLESVTGATGFPDGAHVTQDGRELLAIPAPHAQDADGAPVAVTMSVAGDRLTVHVPHRARDYRYPILVDPDWRVIDNYSGWSNTAGWWTAASSANYGYGVTNWGFSFGNRFGLTVSAKPAAYNTSHWGEWVYSPPANSYIYRAEYEYTSYEYLNQCVVRGLYAGGPWDRHDSYCGTLNNNYITLCPNNCDPNYGSNNNWAILAMQTHVNRTTSRWQGLVVNNMIIYQRDRYDPWLASVAQNAGSRWWPANQTLSATVQARDTGLGVHSVALSGPGVSQSRNHGCSGTHWSRCPLAYDPTFTYSTNSLPEGHSTIGAQAHDINNRGSAWSWWGVKVDRTASNLPTVTGPLSPAGLAATNNWVKGDNLTLTATATDNHSGVKNLMLAVETPDHVYQYRDTRPSSATCGPDTGCPSPRTEPLAWDTQPASVAEGEHRVKVVARDALDHWRETADWPVKVDKTKPTVDSAAGSLRPPSGQWLGDDTYSVNVAASDPRSGVTKLELKIDNSPVASVEKPCPAGACSMNETLSASTSNLTDGPHTVSVTATDQAKNTSDATSWQIMVDRTAPDITLDGTLSEQVDTVLTEPAYSLTTAATDGSAVTPGSGVKSITVYVDNAADDHVEQACPFGSCAMSDSYVYDPNAWEDNEQVAGHDVTVEVYDQADNQDEITFHVDAEPEEPLPPLECPVTATQDLPDLAPVTADQAVASLQQSPLPVVAATVPATIDAEETLDPSLTTNASLGFDITGARIDGQIANLLAEGVRVDGGYTTFCLKPVGTDPSALPARVVNGDTLVYANSRPAVDTAIRPTVLGVEIFENIRASGAPTTFRYRVALDADDSQELVKLSNGSVALLGPPSDAPDNDPEDADSPTNEPPPAAGDQSPEALNRAADQLQNADHEIAVAEAEVPEREVLAHIDVPWARDRLGATVPTRLDVAGDTITLTVEHTGGQYAYPIVADPKASAKGCYRRANPRRPYRFRVDWKTGLSKIPKCRHARHHTIDKPPQNQNDLNPGDNAQEQPILATNPNQGGERKWPLFDSLGNAIAYLRSTRPTPSNPRNTTWTLFASDGQTVLETDTRNLTLELTGHACMMNPQTNFGRRDYGIFVTGFSGVNGKVRGFMRYDAFPERSRKHPKRFPGLANPYYPRELNRPEDRPPKYKPRKRRPDAWEGDVIRSNQSLLHKFGSDCGADISNDPGVDRNVPGVNFVGPDPQQYVGRTSGDKDHPKDKRCQIERGPNCGQYSNYRGATHTPVNGQTITPVVMMTSSSTSVRSGGVVRAIFPVGTNWSEQDRIGYADPNVPCDQDYRWARWRYGRVTASGVSARGWIPSVLSRRNNPHCNNPNTTFTPNNDP